MTGPALNLEESVNADVYLMGSFLYSEYANDIDLVLVYRNANYNNIKKLKSLLAEAIYKTFHISVHYTTLSKREYEEMKDLRLEKHCVLYESCRLKEE